MNKKERECLKSQMEVLEEAYNKYKLFSTLYTPYNLVNSSKYILNDVLYELERAGELPSVYDIDVDELTAVDTDELFKHVNGYIGGRTVFYNNLIQGIINNLKNGGL